MKYLKINALISAIILLAVSGTAFTSYLPYEVELDEKFISDEFLVYNASFPGRNVLEKLGEISGVYAVNSSHIYVFHRANRFWQMDDFDENETYTKQEFGPIKKPTIALLVNGKITKEFGEGIFFMPHSITSDKHGNVWVTDVALHQVFKFSHDDFLKPALILGERFKPGNDDKHFCKPTDVKVASNGEFFVSDGYCNKRVLKFKPDGTLITYWGQDSSETESLSLPHGLALVEESNVILVADRENNRIVSYSACQRNDTGCGHYLSEWILDGPVYAIDFDPLTKQIFALVGQKEASIVQIVDFESPDVVEEISGLEHFGFGMGHTLSVLKTTPGFVVGSIIPDCPEGIPCGLLAGLKKDSLHGGLYLYKRA